MVKGRHVRRDARPAVDSRTISGENPWNTLAGRLASVCDLTVSVIEPFDLTNKRICVCVCVSIIEVLDQISIIVLD